MNSAVKSQLQSSCGSVLYFSSDFLEIENQVLLTISTETINSKIIDRKYLICFCCCIHEYPCHTCMPTLFKP